jgi:hypothetical protein
VHTISFYDLQPQLRDYVYRRSLLAVAAGDRARGRMHDEAINEADASDMMRAVDYLCERPESTRPKLA